MSSVLIAVIGAFLVGNGKRIAAADPGFSRWEHQPKSGHQPIIWPNFSKNGMKMKKIGPRGGRASKILLCRSATGLSELMRCVVFNRI